jgi:indole-3-glycerol phosphate synthase
MILDEICAHKHGEVALQKQRVPLREVQERIGASPPPRDFRAALRQPGVSLIAEVKRASPSKGIFMAELDPLELASVYVDAGARCISVLTDEKYFKGTLDDLLAVRHGVSAPCLRKEFIVDEYQIYESRAAQADCILLIVRILSDQQLKDYLTLAGQLDLSVLVEVHDEEEVERAMAAGAHIIGVNNRDLTNFTVDLDTTMRLKKMIPGGYVLVSESGIHSRDHVVMLEDGGIDAILVGEALVTAGNIHGKIAELLGRDRGTLDG